MARPPAATVNAAILAGCAIAFLSFGLAVTFGVFMKPISDDMGWSREVLSLSLGLQMLVWGCAQPFAGAMADRAGAARVLGAGALCASFGFLVRGLAASPEMFLLSGPIIGVGTGACSFPVVLIALGKAVAPERRSFIMGLGTAAASFSMFVAAPVLTTLIEAIGWRATIYVISAAFLLIPPCLIFISRVSAPTAAGSGAREFTHALKVAFSDRSYLCLFTGFFVCGFHVAFIQTHLPAYITDLGLAVWLGGWSLALIGLFNIAGSFMAGWSGRTLSKKKVLSGIYFARAVVIAIFIMTPISPETVLVFSAAMGLLWLSTVPLTTGLVAQTQGLTYLSTLAGLVFFSHQVGSFLGAWLGGVIYESAGDYTPMWWAAVALGLAAALIHLPIREAPGPLARAEAG